MTPFPTRSDIAAKDHVQRFGQPRRAMPCRCDRPLPDEDDMCLGCGRYASEAISQTWSEQAAATALPMEPERA